MPSPRDFNILKSLDFNANLKKVVRESNEPQKVNVKDSSTSKNLKQFLQPQLAQRKSREKQLLKNKLFAESKMNSSNERVNTVNSDYNDNKQPKKKRV